MLDGAMSQATGIRATPGINRAGVTNGDRKVIASCDTHDTMPAVQERIHDGRDASIARSPKLSMGIATKRVDHAIRGQRQGMSGAARGCDNTREGRDGGGEGVVCRAAELAGGGEAGGEQGAVCAQKGGV